ncbi:MAG: hypothetical protein HOY76_15095 [Streptomyces sp.]|nr:hypothetical protein [Streptomyces sp.]NUS17314.1 hypothetical protein [Streptomyces sp.]
MSRAHASGRATGENYAMSDRGNVPDPVPRGDRTAGRRRGRNPEPTMEPASRPSAAKAWAVRGVLLLALAALAVLIVAVLRP